MQKFTEEGIGDVQQRRLMRRPMNQEGGRQDPNRAASPMEITKLVMVSDHKPTLKAGFPSGSMLVLEFCKATSAVPRVHEPHTYWGGGLPI